MKPPSDILTFLCTNRLRSLGLNPILDHPQARPRRVETKHYREQREQPSRAEARRRQHPRNAIVRQGEYPRGRNGRQHPGFLESEYEIYSVYERQHSMMRRIVE